MSGLPTRVLPPEEYPRWERFVAESPDGSPYANPRYLEVLAAVTGGTFEVVVAEKGDQLQGGVVLFTERRDGLVTISPRVLLYYSGFVFRPPTSRYPSERTAAQLAACQALAAAAADRPADIVRIKSRPTVTDVRPLQALGWSVDVAYSYQVPLDEPTLVLGRIDQNLRRLIKRADAAGLVATVDDDFDAFFRLHHDVHQRKGARLYLPREAFRRYVADLRAADLAELHHARLPTGEVVATALVIADGHPVAHLVAAGSDAAHQAVGANPFLRWKIMERLLERGYRGLDLTDAALNEVTRFKSQLGGELVPAFVLERPPSRRARLLHARAGLRGRIGALARRIRGLAARSVRPAGSVDSRE